MTPTDEEKKFSGKGFQEWGGTETGTLIDESKTYRIIFSL